MVDANLQSGIDAGKRQPPIVSSKARRDQLAAPYGRANGVDPGDLLFGPKLPHLKSCQISRRAHVKQNLYPRSECATALSLLESVHKSMGVGSRRLESISCSRVRHEGWCRSRLALCGVSSKCMAVKSGQVAEGRQEQASSWIGTPPKSCRLATASARSAYGYWHSPIAAPGDFRPRIRHHSFDIAGDRHWLPRGAPAPRRWLRCMAICFEWKLSLRYFANLFLCASGCSHDSLTAGWA